jgi:4,5-DOPA dioxygenase extradiol
MAQRPRTIHDFSGFDPALYELQYPADGHPLLAQRALDCLRTAGWQAEPDAARGLDHGAWVPLKFLYPAADVPVFQVSMPHRFAAESAWALGQALRPLADDGVLILGSGSLTHNLHEAVIGSRDTPDYVHEFVAWVQDAVVAGDSARLRQTLDLAPHAARAHPTPEHFWPLLVAAGAAATALPVTVIQGGVEHNVVSMNSYVFGAAFGP